MAKATIVEATIRTHFIAPSAADDREIAPRPHFYTRIVIKGPWHECDGLAGNEDMRLVSRHLRR